MPNNWIMHLLWVQRPLKQNPAIPDGSFCPFTLEVSNSEAFEANFQLMLKAKCGGTTHAWTVLDHSFRWGVRPNSIETTTSRSFCWPASLGASSSCHLKEIHVASCYLHLQGANRFIHFLGGTFFITEGNGWSWGAPSMYVMGRRDTRGSQSILGA